MTLLGNQGFLFSLFPLSVVILLSLGISISSDLNLIGFVGVTTSLGASTLLAYKLCRTIYDTWIGVCLGHNINLKSMGKWAVVTGATDGIGLAFACELAKRGLNVVLMSRSLDKLKLCAKEIESVYKVETKVVQVDFTQDIFSYQNNVDKELEGMEIGTLINNVGMTYNTPETFHRVANSVDFVNKIICLNVTAVTMMTRAVLPGMIQRRKGVILNVGSLASVEGGIPFFTLYSATKSYMESLTINLAREYQSKGIYFQYQCPGYVTTKISKIKKSNFFIPTPRQYAATALKTVGLQQYSAVWISQRIIIPIMKMSRFVLPGIYEFILTDVARTFWLFAKKREMQRDKGYVEAQKYNV